MRRHHIWRLRGLGLGIAALVVVGNALAAQATATHPEGALLASLRLSGRPYGVAVSSQGLVYVARLDAASLGVVQLPDTILGNDIAVGQIPSHVAFNPRGTRAYVANQGSHSVSVVDVARRMRLVDVPVGTDAWNVIVSPDGFKLYATTNQGSLWVMSTMTNEPDTTIVVSEADALRGLAFNRQGTMLYVSGRNSGNIYVVRTSTRRVVDTITVGGTPQRIALSPDEKELYVANEARGLDVVTLADGAITTVPLGGGGYGLALSPDGAQLYVTVPGKGSLQIVDRADRAVVRTITFANSRPRTVAFSPLGDRAVVSDESGALHLIR